MRLIFATQNLNKVEEIRKILDPDIELISLLDLDMHDDIPETSMTLEENAFQKARYIFDKFKITTIADDTGLEVEALEGEPGVLSARYAGDQKNSDDNIDKLLHKLNNKRNMAAQFRTIIAMVGENESHFFEGKVAGVIIRERRGSNGFGYDPVFIPEGYEKTFAQMTLDEKNQISHRAMAIKKFVDHLTQTLNRL